MNITKFFLNSLPRPALIKISLWIHPIIAFLLKGHQFTDPIDGKSFRYFLPYGYGKIRYNVLSPSTLSLERHRLMWLFLKNKTDFFSAPKKVLHIAPEQCFIKLFRNQQNLDYLTTDLYSPLADVKADILNLPFDDNSFDVVFCNHVLEHIIDDQKAMSELYRVMKKGGFGIFQVPQDLSLEKTYEDFSITSPKDRAAHFGQYDHVRIYGKDYFNRLEKVGFEVYPVNLSSELSAELLNLYRLTENEIIPYCKK
ncbi:MAG TPA: methyltransferase domain-containing protein [Flavobacteriaceae bacterium]|nr:methyltransferase domain-containing protein [Flavobacteriaceae bacterium]